MAVLQTGLAKSLAEDYTIDQSLRFDDGDSAFLKRTPSIAGNRKTWTFSCWLKRTHWESASHQVLFGTGTPATGTTFGGMYFQNDGSLYLYDPGNGAGKRTEALLRDPGAWYHIMGVMDATNTVCRIYINGDEVTSFVSGEDANPSNADGNLNNTTQHTICRNGSTSAFFLDGYLAEVYFIDGQALTPSSFGETDTTTNQWKPIDAVDDLTFGTNGFYQKYAATELADSFADSSGSGNHTITAEGDAHTDTAIKKFGTASAQFDGTGDSLNCGTSDDFDFDSENFTIEMWVYLPTLTSDQEMFYGQHQDGNNKIHFYTDGFGKVYWNVRNLSSTVVYANTTSAVLAATTWYHIAWVRSGSTFRFYVDGAEPARTDHTAYSGGDFPNLTADVQIGGNGVEITRFTGYVDEVRVSNTARYVGDFIAPTEEFTPDNNTLMLLHCDGANDGTSFPDSSNKIITANGDVANTRAEKKVGDSSIAFDGSGDYLTVPDSSDWDRGTGSLTLELWARFNATGTAETLFMRDYAGGKRSLDLKKQADNTIYASLGSGGDWFGTITSTTALSADTWYHIAYVRDGNDFELFIDGTSEATDTDSTSMYDSDTGLYIGMTYDGGISQPLNGYLDEIRYSDSARYTSNFTPATTEFTADSNTMLLIHSNWDGGLGADSSGNNNTFTPTNLVASDKMVDSPTNNFCTLNPIVGEATSGPRMSYQTMSEGNLKTICNTTSDSASVSSTFGFTDGKWYYEAFDDSTGSIFQDYPHVGIIDVASVGVASRQAGQTNTLGVVYARDGDKYIGGSGYAGYGDSFTTGDVIGMAIDADNGAVYFSKNGVWQNSGDPESGASRTGAAYTYTGGAIELTPAFVVFDTDMGWVANFGQDSSFAGNATAQGNQDENEVGDFYYEPPSGYLALCTSNLPDPEIKLPGDHFNTVLYTGDASTRSITGVGFQPDFIWAKSRSDTRDHVVSDSVRGVEDNLSPNTYGAGDDGATNAITSFDSDGWTMGSDGLWNANTETFVAWNWLAPDTFDPATAGTVTTGSGRSNSTAGFSIVGYTGESSSMTIGHGLSQAPEIISVKRRDGAIMSWGFGTDYVSGTWDFYMRWNSADMPANDNHFWNDTTPTSSVFTVGTAENTNTDGGTHIAYCWHSVEGYSRMGSFVGNNNTDGFFIYTGFRPAYLMVKRTTGSVNGSQWAIWDDARNTYNVEDATLKVDSNAIEETAYKLDFVSNGVKMRLADTLLNNGTYLYIAFAESPFKYANAR
jgi:hypothetical protein